MRIFIPISKIKNSSRVFLCKVLILCRRLVLQGPRLVPTTIDIARQIGETAYTARIYARGDALVGKDGRQTDERALRLLNTTADDKPKPISLIAFPRSLRLIHALIASDDQAGDTMLITCPPAAAADSR